MAQKCSSRAASPYWVTRTIVRISKPFCIHFVTLKTLFVLESHFLGLQNSNNTTDCSRPAQTLTGSGAQLTWLQWLVTMASAPPSLTPGTGHYTGNNWLTPSTAPATMTGATGQLRKQEYFFNLHYHTSSLSFAVALFQLALPALGCIFPETLRYAAK